MSEGICYVAFSGGLDSTWVLYDLLSQGKNVKVVQVNVASGVTQLIPETFARREILNYLYKRFPDQIKDEILFPYVSQSLNFRSGLNFQTGKITQAELRNILAQQISIRNALLSCSCQGNPWKDRYFVGWHKDDVPSTFGEDGYDYLCDLTPLIRITDAEWFCKGMVPRDLEVKIERPCWNLDKLDMWKSLPEEIQNYVIVGGERGSTTWNDDLGHVQSNYSDHSKFKEYVSLGFTPKNMFIFKQMECITDILYVHLSSAGIDGVFGDAFPDHWAKLFEPVTEKYIQGRKISSYFKLHSNWENRIAHCISVKRDMMHPHPYLSDKPTLITMDTIYKEEEKEPEPPQLS